MPRFSFQALTGAIVISAGILTAPPLSAQVSQTAQVKGRVLDSQGAAVPSAKLTLTNIDTGSVHSDVSDSSGDYTLLNLPAGNYTLVAEAPGFTRYVQSGIVLLVNTNPTVAITLKVGATNETVNVSSSVSQVETQSNGVGQVIDTREIVDLPLNGRQASQLVLLSGAAVIDAGTNLISNKNYPTAVAISIAGAKGNQTMYYVDGAVNLDPLTNVGLPFPFPDALQEFKIETNSLPANYGTHPGGVVNIITRSGTNNIHGDLFEFYRNFNFNARNFFATVRDPLKRHQFGGVIGGPILKNKVFLFAGYQGTFESTSSSAVFFVPTAATLSGDFTAFESPACHGGTQGTLGGPFVNNKVSSTALNSIALNFLKYIPVSLDPCGRYTNLTPFHDHENQFVERLDYQMNARNSFFERYFITDYAHPPSFTNNLLTLAVDANAGLADRVQTLSLGHTLIINANATNILHIGASRPATQRYEPSGIPTPTQLGSNVTQGVNNYINFNVAGYFNVACANCNPGPWISNTEQIGDDFTLIRGHHQIGFGALHIQTQTASRSNFQRNGNFTFNGNLTGNSLADLEVGLPITFLQGNAQINYSRQYQPSAYVQDTWKASPRLTVNAGLRWDPFLPVSDKEHRVEEFRRSNFDAGIVSSVYTSAPAGLLFYGDNDYPGSGYTYGNKHLFSPRIGVILDPRGKGLETIRAGYGIFYDFGATFLSGNIPFDAPFANSISLTAPVGGLTNPYLGYPGGNPFPTTFPIPANATFPTAGSYTTLPAHVKPTYVQQYNLSLQKQFAGGWLATVTYLGNKTTHQWLGNQLNPAVYSPGATVASTQARRVLTLANPNVGKYYGGITNLDDSAYGNYNAVLASVEHHFSDHYSLLTNYTYSHCLDLGDSNQNSTASYQNPSNPSGDYGNCNSDRRHILNVSGVLKAKHFDSDLMKVVASDWQLAPIFTAQSGAYFTVLDGVDNSLTGVGLDRPNQIGSAAVAHPSRMQFFNTAAFVRSPTGTFGTVARNSLLGPGAYNVDVAASRVFPTREKQSFEFRWEVFNLLNHTRYNLPNATLSNAATFGTITSAQDPRIMQFAAKYQF